MNEPSGQLNTKQEFHKKYFASKISKYLSEVEN